MAGFHDALCWVQKQYFQAVAMKNFDWEKLRNESNIAQTAVLNAVCRVVIGFCFIEVILWQC